MADSIQSRTFTRWLNLQLDSDQFIDDLGNDLSDGQRLIAVVERLLKKRCTGKIYTSSPSELQCTMNVQMALDALREDGMRLVNIAAKDIVDGDLKVVHSLVWLLIQKYHIASRAKIPAKKLIMAWVQSVLPDLTITNFRSAWNDGRALSALLEYCQPGLCPEWRGLPAGEGLVNCDRALDLADRYLDVPRILSVRDLHDDQLDEQSLLTYLAYFVRVYGPGYAATLVRAQESLGDIEIPDLATSWADGYQLCLLVESVGGSVPHEMRFDTRADWVQNVESALASSEQLGVRSLVSAEDIVDGRATDHLGVMSLVAALCSLNGSSAFPVTQSFQNQQVNIDLAFGEGEEVRVDDLTVEVLGPSSTLLSHSDISLRKARTRSGVVLSLIPTEIGPHEVRIFCQGEELPSSPVALQVLPLPVSAPTLTVESTSSRREAESLASTALPSPSIDENNLSFAERRAAILQKLEPQPQVLRPAREFSSAATPIQKPTSPPPPPPTSGARREPAEIDYAMPPSGLVSFSGLSEPCPVGSIVEVVINAHGDSAVGAVQVEAVSPSGKKQKCSVRHSNTHYTATFTPHEVGSWKICILYDNEHINESPFDCKVFDANQVNVYGLNVGLVGQQLKFSVNTAQAGVGDLEVSVVRLGQVIPSEVHHQGDKSSGIYTVSFTPEGAGQYNIHVLFNKMQVKGSPFILDIADASSVSVYGDNLKVASVDKLSSFIVHAVNASVKDITVSISAPSGKQKLARITQIDPETFRAEWKAVEAGEHQIDVRLYDQSVYEEPITCNVGDPDLVTVKGMPKRILSRNLGQEHCFEIDASAAGSGNLEIMINGGRVPCRVRELGSRQYLALFTPGQSTPHTVEMRFNGEEVRGNPWHIHIEDSDGDIISRDDRSMSPRGRSIYSEISGSGLVRAAVGKNSNFDITGDSIELDDIKAVVTTPDGREVPVRITPKGVGKFTAEYRIHEVGEHQLNVWIAGRKVDTSPLYIAGYSSERVKLEPLGGGVPGQPVQFVVDAVDAGKGQLEISVNQGRVPNNVQMQGAGRCLVTFIPQQPGTYVIDVTFNGELVHGCPIRVEILPKQVGQQVVAPLHTTSTHETVTSSTASFHPGAAIAGSTVLASSASGPRSPTSPTLLRAARQRDANEGTPRSASLLRDIGSSSSGAARYESAGFRGASYSPRRGDAVYSPDSYVSPVSTLRREQLDREREYAGVHHEGDRQPPSRHYAETTTTYRTESPQATLSRTSDLPPSRQLGSYPPTSSASSATTVHTVQHRTNRSPSPGSRRRPIEQLDPLAAEAERESRRGAWQRDAPASERGVGYTVAAYGERVGGDTRTDSPTFQTARQRFERREEEPVAPAGRPPPRPITPPRDFEVEEEKPHGFIDKIVEKSKDFTEAVEDKVDEAKETLSHLFDKKRDRSEERMVQSPERESSPSRRARIAGRPASPPRDFEPTPSSILRTTVTSGSEERTPFYKSYTEEGTTYRRSMSPQDEYRSTRDRSAEYRTPHMFVETETERTVSPTGDEVRETTTTRTTTYSVSPRSREVDVHITRHSDAIRTPQPRAPLPGHSDARFTGSTTTRGEMDRPSERRDPSIEEHRYPDASLRRVATEAKDKMRHETGARAGDRFTRTQSDERVDQHERQPSEGDGHLRRTDEVERIYDDVPRYGETRESTTVTRREEPVPSGRIDRYERDIVTSGRVDTTTRREEMPPSRYEGGFPREEPTRYETRDSTTVTRRDEPVPATRVDRYETTTTSRREDMPFVPSARTEERSGYEARDPGFGREDTSRYETRESTTVTRREEPAGRYETRDTVTRREEPVPAGRVDRYETTTTRRDEGRREEYDDGKQHVDPVYDHPPRESGQFDERFVGEVQQLGRTHELPHSPPVSTPTTPKMSSKFKKEGDGHRMFDFGKSKFSSKHEVIRRGKDVEVKLDSLKLSKEDTMRIVVLAPMKHSAPDEAPAEIEPKVKKSGTKFEISFKPTEVGTHKVFAYVNEVQHPLSPYAIRVYDAAEIVVGEIPHHSYLNDTVEFTVDAGRAGFGNLEMAIKDADGVIIPSHVAQLESGSAKFLVTFSPTTRGPHTVNITFNKEILRNSPFEVIIDDPPAPHVPVAQMSPALGAEVEIPPGTPDLSKRDAKKAKEDQKREEKERAKREKEEKAATLKREKELKKQLKKAGVSPGVLPKTTSVVKTPSLSRVGAPATIQVAVAGQDSLEITVTHICECDRVSLDSRGGDAKKDEVGTKVTEIEPGLLEIEFVPQHVGEHEIDVRYAGAAVPGSPFTCRAYDPAKISVGTIPNGVVERPVHFIVDASEAGVGNLEVAVNDGKIPSMANGLGQHRYDISFTPHEEIDHFISVRFNNEPVPGSPFLCRLVSATKVTAAGPGLERIAVDEEAAFTVHTQGEDESAPIVSIRGPHAAECPAVIEKSRNQNEWIVKYAPTAVGSYQIDVSHAGEPIAGSPFAAKAYDVRQVKLTPCEAAQVGRPCHFSIDAANAGAGNMEIIVSVEKKNVPNFVQSEGQARFRVSFTPQEERPHTISVKFNGVPVTGSPMTCEVSSAGTAKVAGPLLGAAAGAVAVASQATRRETAGADDFSDRLGDGKHAAVIGQSKGFALPAGGRGDCNVIVTAPDGTKERIVTTRVRREAEEEEELRFEVTPEQEGEYSVEIFSRRDNGEVQLTTLTLLAAEVKELSYSAETEAMRDRLPHICLAGKKYSFEIETQLHTKEDVHVDIRGPDGRSVPVQMENLPDNGGVRASARFKKAGNYSIDVFVEETPLSSNQMVTVLDPKPVDVSPPRPLSLASFLVAVHFPRSFTREIIGESAAWDLHVDQELWGEVEAQIQDPEGNLIPCSIRQKADTDWVLEWVPKTEGEHEVSVIVRDVHVADSPLTAVVIDPSAVRVIGLRNERVGVEQRFNVDFTNSGASEARVTVSRDRELLAVTEKKLKDGLIVCAFTPKIPGVHSVDVMIDGILLPECPYEVMALAAGAVKASGDALQRAQRGRTATFEISLNDSNRGELDVFVTDSTGGPLPVRCYKQADDSYWVEFTPEHTGVHTIEATFGDVPIVGSPFKCTVVDPKKVTVVGIDAPLTLRHVSTIGVRRADAGTADLSVEVTDPSGSQIRTEVMKSPRGEDSYTFLPTKIGPHRVAVKCAGFSVPGSPFTVDVEEHAHPTAYGGGIERAIEIGAPASIIFDAKRQTGGVQVEVKDPSGNKIKHKLNKRDDGTMEVNFEPREIGTHRVHVAFNSMAVPGSPFKVDVVDAAGVQVRGIEEALLLKHAATMRVDTSRAGNAPIEVDVTDPVGAPVRTEILRSPSMGEDKITFLPARPGPHRVDVRIGGVRVPGFPRTVDVDDDGEARAPRVTLANLENGGRVGDAVSFVFDARKQVGGLKVEVRGPDGRRARHQTRRRDDGAQEITFYPEEVGEYVANVEHNNRHVQGSPLTLRVVDPSKVLVDDESLDREGRLVLAPSQRATLNVDVTAAGPGKLRAEVEDDQGRAVTGATVEEIGFGKHRVNWTPRTPGTYMLYLSYEGHPVHGANPLKMVVGGEGAAVSSRATTTQSTTATGRGYDRYEESSSVTRTTHDRSEMPSSSGAVASEAGRVHLTGDGVSRPLLNEPNEFIIDASDCDREGQLTATMFGSKMDVPIRLTNIGKNMYRASYTPLSPGKYELRVEWEGSPVQGTPMTIEVHPTAASAADQIVVDASTLKIGVINDDVKTLIDTRKAGPGQLSAQCMGPVKLAYCELYDHRDGTYTLSVKPTEVGKHTLTIKYNERHVPGSPFLVHVSNPPDASKVRVYGPGIEHGILSHFKSNFVVETKGAGAGQLTVRVRGPKGAFNVEMQREKKNERTIHCKYEPREPGDYQVEVKWHGEHVPGSPYLVMIVDTEQELTRFLRGEAPSPIPATPFIPPGWVGPAPPPPHMFMGGPPPMGGPRFLPPGGPPPPGMHMAPYGAMPPPGARMAPRHGGKYANGY